MAPNTRRHSANDHPAPQKIIVPPPFLRRRFLHGRDAGFCQFVHAVGEAVEVGLLHEVPQLLRRPVVWTSKCRAMSWRNCSTAVISHRPEIDL